MEPDTGLMLQEYTAADCEACLRVFDTNVPRFFRPREREEFVAFLSELPGPYLLLVARESRDVLACGGYAVSEDGRADLCWGMAHQDVHGRGLGRLLTEARLEGIRRTRGARTVSLHTSQHTVGFYERLGFRTTRFVPEGYAPGLDRYDMLLDLEP